MNEPVKPEISYILPPEYQHFTSYKERADALGRISVWVTTDKGTLRRVGRKRFRQHMDTHLEQESIDRGYGPVSAEENWNKQFAPSVEHSPTTTHNQDAWVNGLPDWATPDAIAYVNRVMPQSSGTQPDGITLASVVEQQPVLEQKPTGTIAWLPDWATPDAIAYVNRVMPQSSGTQPDGITLASVVEQQPVTKPTTRPARNATMHMSWPIDRPAVATPQRQSRLREFLESVSKSAQLNRKIGRGVLAAMGVLGIGFGAIATSSDNSHSDFRIPAVESPWEQPAETDYNTDAGTPIINPTTPLIMPKEPAPFAERPIAPTASNLSLTASVPETIKTPEIDLVISKLINDPSVMPYTLLEELGVPSDDRVYALNATIAAYAKEHKVLFVLCADGIIREVGTDRIISPEENKLLKEFMYLDLL